MYWPRVWEEMQCHEGTPPDKEMRAPGGTFIARTACQQACLDNADCAAVRIYEYGRFPGRCSGNEDNCQVCGGGVEVGREWFARPGVPVVARPTPTVAVPPCCAVLHYAVWVLRRTLISCWL